MSPVHRHSVQIPKFNQGLLKNGLVVPQLLRLMQSNLSKHLMNVVFWHVLEPTDSNIALKVIASL